MIVFNISPDGRTIYYSITIGGSKYDEGKGITLSKDGSVWIVGTTDSIDFPITKDSYKKETDEFTTNVFIAKLSVIKPTNDLYENIIALIALLIITITLLLILTVLKKKKII